MPLTQTDNGVPKYVMSKWGTTEYNEAMDAQTWPKHQLRDAPHHGVPTKPDIESWIQEP